MKKLLAALLICLLTLSLPMALAEADVAVGTWYLHTVVLEGTEMNAADIGYDMIIIIEPDETASLSRAGQESITGTWKKDAESVTLEMSTTTWVLAIGDDESLTMEQDGTALVFRKEQPLPTDDAPALEFVAPEAFEGKWKVENVRIEGSLYPESAVGTNLTLTIEGTNVLWKQTGGMDAMPSMEAMIATIDGNSFSFTDSGDSKITCVLLEDGSMKMSMDDNGAMIFYLVKAEAE